VATVNIFFISFKEHNCEENWLRLLSYHPDAKRIHGITGIDNVHMACNNLSNTEYFWTVDGDNWLTKSLEVDNRTSDLILYKAIDPIHNAPTLLGGVKLWRKDAIINPNMNKGDFSLNATKEKIVLDRVFSITRYNSSPFDAWKTAFRHCVKLMSVILRSRPDAKGIDTYINQWKESKNSIEQNSEWCYLGYLDAEAYVSKYDNNMFELNKINDYLWLESFFENNYKITNENRKN
jgi:hypothetical protein